MCCHDQINEQTIPVFEFVTTSHTSCNISTFLSKASYCFDQLAKQSVNSIARVIVIDQSWAMINSVVKSFNSCSMIDYLDWCYDLVVNKHTADFRKFKTIVYICSGHFLKSFIVNCRKASSNKLITKTLTFAFTLLQSSTSLHQFQLYLFHIQNIFTSQYHTANVQKSIDTIHIELRDRDQDRLNINFSDQELSAYSTLQCDTIQCDINNESSLVKNSPFAKYFDQVISSNKSVIASNDKHPSQSQDNSATANQYYDERLFALIRQKLFLIPLWTGIMLDICVATFPNQFDSRFSRLTNNVVEGYFGHIKKNVLQRSRQLMISELASKLFVRLQSKYMEFYCDDSVKLNYQCPSFDSATQTWVKNRKAPREKSIYYSKSNVFSNNGAWDYINPFPTRDFVAAFPNSKHFLFQILV